MISEVGHNNDDVNLAIPHKKTKNAELTDQQKEENQMIVSYRIRNEHAIGSMKR